MVFRQLSSKFEVLKGKTLVLPSISATVKDILTGNLLLNMEQVILLYFHTIPHKKIILLVFTSFMRNNFITGNALFQKLYHERLWRRTQFELCLSEKLLKFLDLILLLIVCFLQVFMCNLILCKLHVQPKFSRFLYLNAIAFKNFKSSKT